MTTEANENNASNPPLGLGSSEGLAACIRRQDG